MTENYEIKLSARYVEWNESQFTLENNGTSGNLNIRLSKISPQNEQLGQKCRKGNEILIIRWITRL